MWMLPSGCHLEVLMVLPCGVYIIVGATVILRPGCQLARYWSLSCFHKAMMGSRYKQIIMQDTSTPVKNQNCNISKVNKKNDAICRIIGRIAPLLKPSQSPQCYLGAVDHAKNSPHPWPHCKPRLIALIGPLRPYYSSPLILLRCVTEKQCSKLALTLKLTLELSFPAHCISN